MSAEQLRVVSHGLSPDVHLLWVDLDAYASTVPLDGLEPAELARAERMAFRRDGIRFLAARHALYCVLAQALGRSREQVALSFGEFGKPKLVDGDLQFNLSHSGPEALIGLSRDRAIGVDIEQVRVVPDADALVREHFTEAEQAYWASGAAATRDRRFLECWTRKEACVKALGGGVSIALATLDVGNVEPPRTVAVPSRAEWPQVTVCSVAPPSETVAAVAVDGENLVCPEIAGLSRFTKGRRRPGIRYGSWGGVSFPR